MWQERRRLIYRLVMTRCGVYWSTRQFTGWIVSCWKPVYSRGLGERERTEGGHLNRLSREGGQSRPVMTSHVRTLSSFPLCTLFTFAWHYSLSLSVCDTHPGLCFPPRIVCSQKLLFSLGGSFLYYADHFKLYSGFCANHIKVQKVLERGTSHI